MMISGFHSKISLVGGPRKADYYLKLGYEEPIIQQLIITRYG